MATSYHKSSFSLLIRQRAATTRTLLFSIIVLLPYTAAALSNSTDQESIVSDKEGTTECYADMLWESRYVSEGRDNLSGKHLISASSEFEINEFKIIPWIADGPGPITQSST